MFRDVPGCSGMFRNVPGCSMFLVLSTPLELAILLKFRLLCRMLCRYGEGLLWELKSP